ncbi:MAG: DUF3427 domain-containing protein [Lachnospiraceae bacterium]
MIDSNIEILAGMKTAYIDKDYSSNLAFKPQFISNNYKAGKKVLTSLEAELLECKEFIFSVAFITEGGIAPLLQCFKILEERGVKGRILTTDYLCFSDPKALRKLNSYSNIEIRMHVVDKQMKGFHTKGYIFFDQGVTRAIIGSSNMTQSALTQNHEWNTLFVSAENGEVIHDVLNEFDVLWNSAQKLEGLINTYERIYAEHKKIIRQTQIPTIQQYKLQPNFMQLAFIDNLQRLRDKGASKALLISATGTGKTYASAFALRDENPKKALFIVHREQIAKQAMKSFKHVFGDTRSFGLLSGNKKELKADYLFATMTMMAKPDIMERFAPDEFQTIIIDEVHRVGSKSYQRIMDYFNPGFWLGMTASPERTDGFDIYSAFDHKIAYEIRLQQALEENLLCPFHYYGITDLEIEGETFDDAAGIRNFGMLTSEIRVEYIIRNIKYYGFSGKRVKGLIFCSHKQEAYSLSEQFNTRGYRTCCLFGESSDIAREDAMERLVTDEREDYLDYIFTIDIFNEGVDIPEVNQVVMLRPTQSPIVFIQQLGRGLRKSEGKEFVMILDFIGNYMNNFMIPIALSGDRSYNKDSIRRYLMEGTRVIPGSSSIHFDEISKKRIFSAIDTAKFSDIKLIREAYKNLKYKLGRIPELYDFEEYGSIDATRIFDKFGSYYAFLKKYDKENYKIELDTKEEQVIEYVSRKLAKGKRVQELKMLKRLMSYQKLFTYKEMTSTASEMEEQSVISLLNNTFGKETEKKRYNNCVFLEEDNGGYRVSDMFSHLLKNHDFRKMLSEIVDFGIDRYKKYYSNSYRDTNFQLYQKYTYEDVCRLLNWAKNMNAQNIGGYFYDARTKTMPVFINYDKDEDAIAYEDRFITSKELIALSKHPRKITSADAKHIYQGKQEGNRIYLFVRKNKDDNEAKEFYFLGEIFPVGEPNPIIMEKTKDSAFEIKYELDVPVRDDIYDYIVS